MTSLNSEGRIRCLNIADYSDKSYQAQFLFLLSLKCFSSPKSVVPKVREESQVHVDTN
ncbi:unnamed protein product [Schistosoma curassoni]|uniref:Uncharacterized protein n=1 Tax=Schistosoma curassoni TaxID=6186 RepID=A0A183KPU1_9TREM|nr:unnamed protein product [Schistosoma curassoni]